MKKVILFRGKLRAALRPHLENLRVKKMELTPDDYETLLETTRIEFGTYPSKYVTGITDDQHTKMVIESIFDELSED
jgi:hypothetical protein